MSKIAFLLDFDGVFNALAAPSTFSRIPNLNAFDVFHEVQSLPILSRGRTRSYTIRYSPDTVSWFNSLVDDPNVTVRWLTTWRQHTETFPEQFGFKHAPWLQWQDAFNGKGWGKFDAARDFVRGNDFDKVIWVDDDHFAALHVTEDWLRSRPEVFTVAPYAETGLRPRDLEQIDAFLNA